MTSPASQTWRETSESLIAVSCYVNTLLSFPKKDFDRKLSQAIRTAAVKAGNMGGLLSLLASKMATPHLIDRKTGKEIREIVSTPWHGMMRPTSFEQAVQVTDIAVGHCGHQCNSSCQQLH